MKRLQTLTMITRTIITKISRMMRKMPMGMHLVKSLEKAVEVIIPNNYPATLSYSPSNHKHVYVTASSGSNSYQR